MKVGEGATYLAIISLGASFFLPWVTLITSIETTTISMWELYSRTMQNWRYMEYPLILTAAFYGLAAAFAIAFLIWKTPLLLLASSTSILASFFSVFVALLGAGVKVSHVWELNLGAGLALVAAFVFGACYSVKVSQERMEISSKKSKER